MQRDDPGAVNLSSDDTALPSDAGDRETFATALYRDGQISLGKAASLAGIPVAEFMEHASRLGIAVVGGSASDIASDADAIIEAAEV